MNKNNNINITPLVSYYNAGICKYTIYEENRGK